MRKVNCYSNILKKGTYFSFIIPNVNNIVAADGEITKEEKDKALKNYGYWCSETKSEIEEDLKKLALITNEKDYKSRLNNLKLTYINCFYEKEYSDDKIKNFKDKNVDIVFSDEDIELYKLKKKVYEYLTKETTLKYIKTMSDWGEYKTSTERDFNENINFFEKNNTYAKYKTLYKKYLYFYRDIFGCMEIPYKDDYNNIYIHVYDYGYSGDDLEKDKEYLIIKNKSDLDKVIKSSVFYESLKDIKSKYLDNLYKYAELLETHKEIFDKTRKFNNKFSKINDDLNKKYQTYKDNIQNGKFNIKTNLGTEINEKIVELESYKSEIDEMSDTKYNIKNDFINLMNPIFNENRKILANLSLEKFMKKYFNIYYDVKQEIIKKLKEKDYNYKKISKELETKINNFKIKIDELKNKIKDLQKINNVLNDKMALAKYDDKFFNDLLFKDLTNTDTIIKSFDDSINKSFNNQKASLKSKYDQIVKLNEIERIVNDKTYKIEIDGKFTTADFFTNLTADNYNDIKNEIDNLEKELNEILDKFQKDKTKAIEDAKKRDEETRKKIERAEKIEIELKDVIREIGSKYVIKIKKLNIDEKFDKSTIITGLEQEINKYYSSKGYDANNLTGVKEVNERLLPELQKSKDYYIGDCNFYIDQKLREIEEDKIKDLEEQQRLAKEEEDRKSKEAEDQKEKEDKKDKDLEEQNKLNNNNNEEEKQQQSSDISKTNDEKLEEKKTYSGIKKEKQGPSCKK